MQIMKSLNQATVRSFIILTGGDQGAETFLECIEYLTDQLSKTVWICAFEDSHSVKLCNQAENFFDIDSAWNDISKPEGNKMLSSLKNKIR
jgi:hypothetical protein